MGLVVEIDDRRARFVIRDEGGDIVPDGPAWETADSAAREVFWVMLARHVKDTKDRELASGLDVNGVPIIPARTRVGRYAGMTGPGLMPRYDRSRTRTLFSVAAGRSHVTCYWRSGWGRILGYHARGLSGSGRPIMRRGRLVGFIGIPGATSGIVRNVIGMTPTGLADAIRLARDEWRAAYAPDEPSTVLGRLAARLDPRRLLRRALRFFDRLFRSDES